MPQPKQSDISVTKPKPKLRTLKLILGAIALIFIFGFARLALSYGVQGGQCITVSPSSGNTTIVLAYPEFPLPSGSGGANPEVYYSSVDVHTSKGWICTTDTGGLAGSAQEAVFFMGQQPTAQVIAFAPVANSEIDSIRFNVEPPPGGLLVLNQTIMVNVSSAGNVKPNNVVIVFVKPMVGGGSFPTLDLSSPAAFVDTNISLSFGVIPGYGLEIGSQAFLDSAQLAEINASK